ncbi:MAG: capsular polysaccharide synthesis protein [Bacillota bacterium]
MIPKKIHYVWFGGKEKPELAKRCIESWKRFCSDYEIIEWNESNFDINSNVYIRQAYESKKYAFASDLVRLLVVKEHGGIYLDTDVEVVKPFDELLVFDAFIGFENEEFCNTGQGFGSEANSKFIDVMIAEYENSVFINKDGSLNMVGCPHKNTDAMRKLGFKIDGSMQVVSNVVCLPQEYMNPYDDSTGKLNKTGNTYSIHWYAKTWIPKHKVIRSNITRRIRRIFGANCFDFIKRKK